MHRLISYLEIAAGVVVGVLVAVLVLWALKGYITHHPDRNTAPPVTFYASL